MNHSDHRGSRRQNHKTPHSLCNMVNQYQVREQGSLSFNKKILNIIAERDAAIEERDRALLEKKKALEERDAALSLRNKAMRERNDAMMERDHALETLGKVMNHQLGLGGQYGMKRMHNSSSDPSCMVDSSNDTRELQVVDILRRTSVMSESGDSFRTKRAKENNTASTPNGLKQHKGKPFGKDLNKCAASDGLKTRNNWDAKDLGPNQVQFDESVMPVPGCSCTGVFRHCYKWGNGGWQSSCCTTTISIYPLPPVPNKRYARMGGRKMSGSVFTRLLSRLASEGYNFSVPVDLKDEWSKHGTNRYITIK